MMKNKAFIFVIAFFVFLLVPGIVLTIDLYTDWLFFKEVNYTSVFMKVINTRIITGFLFGLSALVFIVINVVIANRSNFPPIGLLFDGETQISFDIGQLGKWIKPLSLIGGIVISCLIGIWGSSIWKEILMFKNSADVGLQDPVFSKDIGFYLFKFPLILYIKDFAGLVIIVSIFIVSLNYLLRGGIATREKKLYADKQVKKHIGILVGLFVVNIAFGFYLSTFHLLFSQHGVIFGAGYTDIHARLFMLRVLSGMTLVSGILLAVGLFRGSWKAAFAPLGLTVLIYVVGYMVYPSLIQNFKVAPNELVLEREYIEHHIRFTRFGYDLDQIEVRPFDVAYNLTGKDIKNNDATIKNIRLWDDAPLLRTNSQLQQIRTYYKFQDVDNDRYVINGEYMQVMMSPRELSYSDLPSKSWINEKLVFTHGYGITMGPVSQISKEGLPEFIIKDIPPISSADIEVTRPEIYFGELSSDYVIVKTNVPEFDYPISEESVYTTYNGKGGVPLSSFVKKAAFSIKYNSAKPILSSDITPESRILFNRNILYRVKQIAPFFQYDPDPYIVVSEEGKLFWIVDAYTVSRGVPYSQPLNRGVNYIRNSLKVVIDAYDGTVHFYISDPDDVLVKVYQAIFPGLFKPLSDMRADLRKHIRYPKGFLQVQADMYSTFHMTDPKVFYNKEDKWEIPSYGERSLEPYYIILKLPEEKEKEEYVLLLPYTPSKRDNLAAWIAGRCDEPNYGKLIVYTFPRDRLIFGPRQIDARIDQDSYISQQLTLWGQRGSQVIRGSLLIIPIESSLLYVQPLYLAAEDKGGLPELRRVILAYENNVVMEKNLEIGLQRQRLFGGRIGRDKPEKVTGEESVSIGGLAREARSTFERAQESLRRGDWQGYGEQMQKLGQILRKMSK
jgi:uncharacterized membrane protein (UPF0182 family)